MNKSILVKNITNTKFNELSFETLELVWKSINEGQKDICPKCYCNRLAYYSSLQFKQCTRCGFKVEWKLGEKQKPLVKHQR